MQSHLGLRLFITGIPTSGKSFLARMLAEKTDGIHVCLDDLREELGQSDIYKAWVNFYLNQDEKKYLAETTPDELWRNVVRQSEGLWPALVEKINAYAEEPRPVIFESVNILPHLANEDLDFPGIVLLGNSYEETLERNMRQPRWGRTSELQELEAKTFWEIERLRYKQQAEAYGYPAFANSDTASIYAFGLLYRSHIPRIIRDVGFDFIWDSRKVWALAEPAVEMPVSELLWHFDFPFWEAKDTDDFNLTPWEVIKDPDNNAHSDHMMKIQEAELAHPIDIMENKGRWLILDGLHRLVKAHQQGEKVVKVRKIPRSRIPEIAVSMES